MPCQLGGVPLVNIHLPKSIPLVGIKKIILWFLINNSFICLQDAQRCKSCYPLNSLIAILVEMGNFKQQSDPFGAPHTANCNQQGPSADMWGYPKWCDQMSLNDKSIVLQGQGRALQKSWGCVGDSISSVSMNWDIWAMLLTWTHSVNKVLVRYFDLVM